MAGFNIGDLLLRLGVNTEGLESEIVKKGGAAGDKAGKTIGGRLSAGLRGSFKGFGADLKAGLGIGAGIGAFGLLESAVSGVVNILGDATQAALEEEKSIAGLDAALKANVAGWDGNRDAIEEVLASRMRLGFADDEQRESLGRLISVTKDANKALELQRTAMDLARLRGIDLAAASDIVGKVYGGNVGILSRYGIQLEKGTDATEALAEIQRRAAGQAEAYAETNEGKLLASQIKVGEAMEELGNAILPVVADIMPVLADAAIFLVDALKNLVAIVSFPLRTAFDLFRPVLEKVGEVLGMVAGWVQGAFDALKPLADFIGSLHLPWEKSREEIKAEQDKLLADAAQYARDVVAAQESAADGSIDAVERNRASFGVASDAFAGELPEAVEDAKDEAVKVARRTPLEIADALREKRTAWQQALDQLGDDLENEMTTAAEIAALKAELAGDNLAKGLKSKDPVVRAQAEATRQLLISRLATLETEARREGLEGAEGYAGGLRQGKPTVDKAGRDVFSGALKGAKTTSAGAYTWGFTTGKEYARGLRNTVGIVSEAANVLAGAASGPLKASSPPKEGPLRTIDKDGFEVVRLFAMSMLRGVPSVARAAFGVAAAASGMAGARLGSSSVLGVPLPSVALPRSLVTGTVAPSAVGGTSIQENHLHVAGALPVETVRDVTSAMRRLQEHGQMRNHRAPMVYPLRPHEFRSTVVRRG